MRSSSIIPNPYGGTPYCKHCGKPLKKRETLGFFEAFEEILAKLLNPFHRTLYGCTGTVANKKYALWKEDCKKIDEENKKIRRQNLLLGVAGKKRPEKPYPPKPPRRVPCPNHYKTSVIGKYNQRFVRKRKTFYDSTGGIYFL